jgi:hypothetical protein
VNARFKLGCGFIRKLVIHSVEEVLLVTFGVKDDEFGRIEEVLVDGRDGGGALSGPAPVGSGALGCGRGAGPGARLRSVAQDVDVRSFVPVSLSTGLKVGGESTVVTVEGNDLVENDPTFHTDVDRGLFDRLPLESQSFSLSSLVTLSTPGIVADSNGLFHGNGGPRGQFVLGGRTADHRSSEQGQQLAITW